MKLWDRKTPWKAKGAGWAFPHLCSSPGAPGKSLVLLALRCWPSASPWQQQALGFPAHCQEQRQQWLCVWANYLGNSRTAEIEAVALYIFIKIISYICALKLGKAKTWNADHGALGIDFYFFPTFFNSLKRFLIPQCWSFWGDSWVNPLEQQQGQSRARSQIEPVESGI